MFDFFIALDGHGLNGFEGFAGIARLSCDPDRDRWEPEVRFFDGIAGGHAVQLSPQGTVGFLGNLSQQLVFFDPRTLTELAYLRDAEVRGIDGRSAITRERELVEKANTLRTSAISDPRGQKLNLPRWRRSKPVTYPVPSYPGPAGIGGNWPAPPADQPPVQIGVPRR